MTFFNESGTLLITTERRYPKGLPEGERHPAEHGRQKPLGGQHPDRVLVPHLQV